MSELNQDDHDQPPYPKSGKLRTADDVELRKSALAALSRLSSHYYREDDGRKYLVGQAINLLQECVNDKPTVLASNAKAIREQKIAGSIVIVVPILQGLLANPKNHLEDEAQRQAIVTEAIMITEELVTQLERELP